jgi:hypothetical protein
VGKQIQISLARADEDALIQFLKAKFPIEVVNAEYPLKWDHKTLARTADATDWIILDTRTIDIIRKSADQFFDGKGDWEKTGLFGKNSLGNVIGWRIRSVARSCVEWTREFERRSMKGRLYLDTDPDPIYARVSARDRR